MSSEPSATPLAPPHPPPLPRRWQSPSPAWSAFHKSEYGSGLLTFINATNALWTWHMNSADESIIADSYTLINIAQ